MNILQKLINAHKDGKQKITNKKEFIDLLFKSVEDGHITEAEMEELNKIRMEYGLTDEDFGKVKMQIYAKAFDVSKADGEITDEEAEELNKIQKYLGIEDQEIKSSRQELARMRLLVEIKNGNLPKIVAPQIILQKGEEAFWQELGSMNEERVINKRYVGNSSGFSFRIVKGVSYRVGSQRGQLICDTGLVPISQGKLVITNKRVIFSGDKKSFAAKLESILDMQLFSNAVQFSENNKSKPKLIIFSEPKNTEIVGAILSQALNNL